MISLLNNIRMTGTA